MYSDLDLLERFEVEHALEEDQQTQSKLAAFGRVISELAELSLVPSALSLQKIKMYSRIKDVQLN